MDIFQLYQELNKFSQDLITFWDPVKNEDILFFENRIKLKLPNDYINFLGLSNGLQLYNTSVYGINNPNLDLLEAFEFEHYNTENPIYYHLIPFAQDGGGNHYCFDTTKMDVNSAQIIFWQHDYSYTEIEKPEVTNLSFTDWVKEVLIEWSLEDYDYDGNEIL